MQIINSRQKNGRHSSRHKEDLIFAPPAKEKREKPTLNILPKLFEMLALRISNLMIKRILILKIN